MRKYRDAAKSDVDSQRALLDSLMGINRNNDREEDQITDFRDERVCKFFITGMCPNDIFVNTKMDEGPCTKVHSEILKSDFEKSKDKYQFDSILEKEFSSKINEADRVIKRARGKLEEESSNDLSNPDLNPDIIRIHAEISKVIADAEEAVDMGDIDGAQELILNKYDDLLKEKAGVLNRLAEQKKDLMKRTGADTYKKLRVCDVCGSYLSIFDSDKRLQDHFMGKQHIGFQYMRDAVDAIKLRREERRLNRDKEKLPEVDGNDRNRPTNDDRGRRDRSSDRYKDRDGRDRGDNRRRDSRDRGDYRRRDNSRDRDRAYRR
eukprot:gene7236-9867_t